MLQSYEAILRNGVLQWIDSPPELAEVRVIVTVLPPAETKKETQVRQRRYPPEKLKGTVRTKGDIVESLFSESEWDRQMDRTARQVEGNSPCLD
jgi:hypothetical protein